MSPIIAVTDVVILHVVASPVATTTQLSTHVVTCSVLCVKLESTPVLHAQPQQIQSAHHVEAVLLENIKKYCAPGHQLENVAIVMLALSLLLQDPAQTATMVVNCVAPAGISPWLVKPTAFLVRLVNST